MEIRNQLSLKFVLMANSNFLNTKSLSQIVAEKQNLLFVSFILFLLFFLSIVF